MEELGFVVILFDNFLKMGKEKITTNIVDEKRKEFERFIYIYGKKYSKIRTNMQVRCLGLSRSIESLLFIELNELLMIRDRTFRAIDLSFLF